MKKKPPAEFFFPDSKASCARVRHRLVRLLDDDLEPLEAAQDRGHLEACPACSREFDEWRALVVGLRSCASLGSADEEGGQIARARAAVMAEIRPASRGGKPMGLLPSLLTVAAAVLALVGLGLLGRGIEQAPPIALSTTSFLDRSGLTIPHFGDLLADITGWREDLR